MGLSCEKHTAFIYDRGGKKRIGQIDPLTSVDWSRIRDDMSMANVATTVPSWDCAKMLMDVHPNRHELVIYRGSERVWEGCIALITRSRNGIEIQARDMMYYTHRTIMRARYNNTYPNNVSVVNRAYNIITTELARKEALGYNILSFVQTFIGADPAGTAKDTPAMSKAVFEEIDELAARSGLDYTVVGRSIILFDRHCEFSRSPQISEDDFIGDILLSEYGMEGATYAAVTDGDGRWGETGGDDPYYGEWEILDTAYQEAVAPGEVPDAPTDGEMHSQAQRNLVGRNPVPLVVRVPDGSRLNPNGALQMKHLVPGIRVPLAATLYGRPVRAMQKLDAVKVVESADAAEAITITLSPASADDVPPTEA